MIILYPYKAFNSHPLDLKSFHLLARAKRGKELSDLNASINHLEARHSQLSIVHDIVVSFVRPCKIIPEIKRCSAPLFPYSQSMPKLMCNALFSSVQGVGNTKKKAS